LPTTVRSSSDLDRRIARALRGTDANAIAALIVEADAAAGVARESALRARERALLSSADAATAREEQDAAAFRWDRLTAATQRLRGRLHRDFPDERYAAASARAPLALTS
jgi:hypothetical protein